MKTMLMVAAGVAVGLTAAIAVLIEVLSRLLPLVLIVAAYFGSWPWLEERALADVNRAFSTPRNMRHIFDSRDTQTSIPLVVRVTEYFTLSERLTYDGFSTGYWERRSYHVWFFGKVLHVSVFDRERHVPATACLAGGFPASPSALISISSCPNGN